MLVSMREWLPWYRRKDYRGSLTEEEKRVLDALHQMDKHPATDYLELPEEVQRYINELEQSVYDAKQAEAARVFFFLAAVGFFIIFNAYHDLFWVSKFVGYLSGGGMILIGWFLYSLLFRRNADEYSNSGKFSDAPTQSDEGFQRHYELLAIQRWRNANKSKTHERDAQR